MKKFNPKQDETVLDVIEPTENANETQVDDIQRDLDLARIELSKVNQEIEIKRKEIRETAKREIDEKEMEIIEKQITRGNERKAAESVIAKQREYDSLPIEGRFMNRRSPGQSVKLTYQKHPNDPVKWWTFEDGKIYTIPRGFSDQINEYYHTPKFIEKPNDMDPNRPSSSIHHIDTSNKKYAFVPINF